MHLPFSPISVQGQSYGNPYLRRVRQPFNDRRLFRTWSLLSDRLVGEQKLPIQQISTNTAEAARFYRFFNNSRVCIEELIKMNCYVKPEVLEGRHILCIGDTTSINLSKRLGRIKDVDQLGVLQDDKTPGFFAHVNLALDAYSSAILGLADILYWKRPQGQSRSKQSDPIKDKESYRWFLGAANAKVVLESAQRISYVFDREADSFELLDYLQNELQQDFVIRVLHNRHIRWQGQTLKLESCLEQSPIREEYQIQLPALDHYSWTSGKRVQRQAREATIQIRFEAVEVPRPKGIKASHPLQLYLVQAQEVSSHLSERDKPICWRLWTTHVVVDGHTARQIINYYLLRWIIEQLFRTIKKKGFDQEATELETVEAILKQTTMAFKAATTVIQLVYARGQYDAQATEEVFDQEQQKVLQKVNERLQGTTQKQKNPFPENKLSWAAWVIARLGGWKGYQSHKPPGPITMKRGLDKFQTIFETFQLFDTS